MPNKNTFIENPNALSEAQKYSFGLIPEITHKGDKFETGEIKLRLGEHKGPNRDFGMRHIWSEHQKELAKMGYTQFNQIANYISDIVVTAFKNNKAHGTRIGSVC